MGKNVILVLLGVGLGVLLAELLARATGAAPEVGMVSMGRYRLSENPRLIYEPIPNRAYEDLEADYGYFYDERSNELGYRGPTYERAKPPGVFRIVVLGDSIAEGFSIERYEETFPHLVEERLNDAGVPTQVLNFAVTGYQTSQEVETLRAKALPYQPDLVLLQYCLNDEEGDDAGIGWGLLERAEGRPRIELTRLNRQLVKSALYRLLRYRIFRNPSVDTIDANGRLRRSQESIEENTVAEHFGVLRKLQQNHGFEVLVVVFPRFDEGLAPYPSAARHRRVIQSARDNGLRHLDLLCAYRDCAAAEQEAIAEDMYHPTVYGHRCAAEAISQYVRISLPARNR